MAALAVHIRQPGAHRPVGTSAEALGARLKDIGFDAITGVPDGVLAETDAANSGSSYHNSVFRDRYHKIPCTKCTGPAKLWSCDRV